MNAVKPVLLTTPDGVERELRFTIASRKRVVDLLGCKIEEAWLKYDVGAIPELLWALLYDEKSQPPKDITLDYLRNLPCEPDGPFIKEAVEAIAEAILQGKTSKNEPAALGMTMTDIAVTSQSTPMNGGSNCSVSAPSASDSASKSSGTDTSNAKSSHASSDTDSSNGSGTSALASSHQ